MGFVLSSSWPFVALCGQEKRGKNVGRKNRDVGVWRSDYLMVTSSGDIGKKESAGIGQKETNESSFGPLLSFG